MKHQSTEKSNLLEEIRDIVETAEKKNLMLPSDGMYWVGFYK